MQLHLYMGLILWSIRDFPAIQTLESSAPLNYRIYTNRHSVALVESLERQAGPALNANAAEMLHKFCHSGLGLAYLMMA